MIAGGRTGSKRGAFCLVAMTAALGACGGEADNPSAPAPTERARPAEVAPARPDLAACPAAEPIEERIRTAPIPVPDAFKAIASTSMDHFAFTTLTGSTVCVDTTWLETVGDAELASEGRFASFDWVGYEAFGHVIVDRTAAGQVIDTGNPPVLSPSGDRLAAVDLGAAGFGSLNAFGVWEIGQNGIRTLAEVSEGFPTGDWRIDGWRGERCVNVSLVPLERQPEDYRDMNTAVRDPWFVAEANGWRPAAGSCPAS